MTTSSTSLIKPRALRPGSTIAVISPASTPKSELVHRGMAHLHLLGYKTVLGSHALDSGPLYYAGAIEDRLSDLHGAFADSTIDGIVCTRGGWGSAELLPYLDVALIRANPKVFIGYSDHTSLHTWLHNEANLVTFYGPMVAADFSRDDGADIASWQHSFHGDGSWSLGIADGLRVLRPGYAEGQLNGGCISIFAEALGTPYAPRIDQNSMLFLEDIGTKPYQWDRMLQHLRAAGMLKHVRGIVLGDMTANVKPDEMPLLEAACLHALEDFVGPVAIGLRSGHVVGQNRSVPLGAWVSMNGDTVEEIS